MYDKVIKNNKYIREELNNIKIREAKKGNIMQWPKKAITTFIESKSKFK